MGVPDVSDKSIYELMSLTDRVAVVTGGAQGLGKAIARRLVEAGAAVVIADINKEEARAAVVDLKQMTSARVDAIRTDVTDSRSVALAVEHAIQQFGGLHIFVNNAGIFPNTPVLETSDEEWRRVIDINSSGSFFGAREAARSMVANQTQGVIINILSTAGFRGLAPGLAAYVTSKHAARGLTSQMALEMAPHGIRVLGVAPTYCPTEGNRAMMSQRTSDLSEDIPSIRGARLGRVGSPDDIARAVLFCASDMSIFMTGSTLMVDGGMTI